MAIYQWATGISGSWGAASKWLGNTVPNNPTADVAIDAKPAGSEGFYNVLIGAGTNVTVNSLDLGMTSIGLEVDGTLTFAPGSAGALGREFQSSLLTVNGGSIVNAGLMFTFIQTHGVVSFTGANPIYIAWELQVLDGTATVDTASIGQYDAAKHILFDGAFDALGSGRIIDLGGKLGGLTVDIETLTGPKPSPTSSYWTQLEFENAGSQINEWNGSSYVSVETTLKLISNAAYVTVNGGRDYTTANALAIGKDGVFQQAGGTLSTGGLTLLAGGLLVGGVSVTGSGVYTGRVAVSGAVVNNGQIVSTGAGLAFRDALTGTGQITFNRTAALPGFDTPVAAAVPGTLEVGAVGAGQTITMLGGDTLILDAPAAFAGTVAGFDGSDAIVIGSRSAVTAASYAANGNGVGTLTLSNGGVTLGMIRLIGDFSGRSFQVTAGTVADSYKIAAVAAPPPVNNFMLTDTTTGVSSSAVGEAYNGPVVGLQNQYISVTPDSLNIASVTPNSFIRTGSGTDAIDVSRANGNNVLDGSTGSNFLVGGTGADTFFVDDRAATAVTWSTVVNFHSGDAATMFGVTASAFSFDWEDNQGAAGAAGLTLHATAPGKPIASLTLAGYTKADLSNGRLGISFSSDTTGPASYLYIHAT